jgi:hypothetical protein
VRPRWQWLLLDDTGVELDRPSSPVFAARFDAETWLGEHWRGLSAQGARTARLLHEGEPVQPDVPLPTV